MKTTDFLEEKIKRTVGYNEAVNKAEFMIGVQVALSKAEYHYSDIISTLESRLKIAESNYQETLDDMETLTSIIQKYTKTQD